MKEDYYQRPANGWFPVGERQTWRTRAGQRRNTATGYGCEWFCKNCSYSPGPMLLPHARCRNCGASLVAYPFEDATEVEVVTTEYGFARYTPSLPYFGPDG